MENKEYWGGRMAALEDRRYQQGAAYYRDVQKQFSRAVKSIDGDIAKWYQRLADNNGITYAAAKKLLDKNGLAEFQWSVEEYIKAGRESAVNGRWVKELENASARHHISYLDAMKLQLRQHTELLMAQFDGGMAGHLRKTFTDQYQHAAFEIAKGTGVRTNLYTWDPKKLDVIISKPWARDGANFSGRIWANKEKLANSLHTELTQNIIRGAPPQKAIDGLTKTMGVSRAQVGRLIMTESAAIASIAQGECLKNLGVERYAILATLDSQTSELCRSLDGKVFDLKDYNVGDTAPPFHPNCRTTTVPHFDDGFAADGERAARDEGTGETYYVPGNMTYREWEKQYVKGAKLDVKGPKASGKGKGFHLDDAKGRVWQDP